MKKRRARLTRAEVSRYQRQLSLGEVGIGGQLTLKSSSALVVGVGGLGNPAATYLAAAGVGTIGLVDGDRVELANLHRQPLFAKSDIGVNKATAARKRLSEMYPETRFESVPRKLTSKNAISLLRPFTVVLDATDNLPARYLINDACALLGKPDVHASALRFGGQVSVFWPPKGPCYRCVFPTPPPPESVESCEDAGIIGAVTGTLGSVQAMQAISIILGKGSPLLGRLLISDGLASTFEEIRVHRNPSCPVCGRAAKLTRLIDYEAFCGSTSLRPGFDVTPRSLDASLRRSPRPILLDVRQPYEHEICNLKRSKLIPLGELPRRMNELDPRSEIVVYCHHGRRSATAVRMLRRAGYTDVKNLMGGLEAWAVQVDPKMPRY